MISQNFLANLPYHLYCCQSEPIKTLIDYTRTMFATLSSFKYLAGTSVRIEL